MSGTSFLLEMHHTRTQRSPTIFTSMVNAQNYMFDVCDSLCTNYSQQDGPALFGGSHVQHGMLYTHKLEHGHLLTAPSTKASAQN